MNNDDWGRGIIILVALFISSKWLEMSKVLTKDEMASRAKKRQRVASEVGDDGESTSSHEKVPEESVNLYKGWTVPKSNFQIPTVSSEDLTPAGFYEHYIRRRRPVVLKGKLPQELVELENWKSSDERMIERAGDEIIMVEKRSDKMDSFGKGNEVGMSFREFMKRIGEGDTMHYLTTQDVRANSDGQPELMSAFMQKLQGSGGNRDFPLRPKLAGNLVPQNINLWIGNSTDGASSGLHHDYHDNFYIVLRGTKRFRLFGPSDTKKMYTRGKLVKVHENGRINYEGEITTAYGADLQSDAAAKAEEARMKAEERLSEAERAIEEGKPGAEEELERAEALLDEAMEAILVAETGSVADEEDFHLETAREEDVQGIDVDQMSSSSEEAEDGDDMGMLEDDNCRIVDKTVKNPNNFSMVDPSILDNEETLKIQFPLLLEAKSAFCECHAGDILYLPASWFHEVTSSSDVSGKTKGHMAFNYWFHPPDADNDFEKPYTTDFWPNDFKNRPESNE